MVSDFLSHYSGVKASPCQRMLTGRAIRLGAGVHSFISVYQLFSFHFVVVVNSHEPIHEALIYFVFLSVGNPKTVLKGGYPGWLCKLFDKALVVALARGALAMCLQMRWHYYFFLVLFSNAFKLSK